MNSKRIYWDNSVCQCLQEWCSLVGVCVKEGSKLDIRLKLKSDWVIYMEYKLEIPKPIWASSMCKWLGGWDGVGEWIGCWVYEWVFGQYQSLDWWVAWWLYNQRYQTQEELFLLIQGWEIFQVIYLLLFNLCSCC